MDDSKEEKDKKKKPDSTFSMSFCKSLLGFIGGIFLSTACFFISIFRLGNSPDTSLKAAGVIGVIVSLGLAFSIFMRLIFLLLIPQLFTKEGRMALMAIAFAMVLSGPVVNFKGNISVVSETLACDGELIANITQKMIEQSTSPIKSVLRTLEKVVDDVGIMAGRIRDSIMKVSDSINEVYLCLKRAKDWLDNLVTVCNNDMGRPYDNCMSLFDGSGLLGKIKRFFSGICHIAKISQLFCLLTAAMKSLVNANTKRAINRRIRKVVDRYAYDVRIIYGMDTEFTQSKSKTEVLMGIKDDLSEQLKFVSVLQTVSSLLIFVTIFLVFFKAFSYRRRYLKKDEHDNNYITDRLVKIDNMRVASKLRGIFPLPMKYKLVYIRMYSIFLTDPERRGMIKGFINMSVFMLISAFLVWLDYALYWMLNLIVEEASVEYQVPKRSSVVMHVEGEGATADMYRSLISVMNPRYTPPDGASSGICLPHPLIPDFDEYKMIGVMYGVCVMTLLFEAYMLRIRHLVAGSFYPARVRERDVWLYNRLLDTTQTGSTIASVRRNLRRRMAGVRRNEGDPNDTLNGCGRCLKFMCVTPVVACTLCNIAIERDGKRRIKICDNAKCQAAYCDHCYASLGNLCSICKCPTEYGDFSDWSEERDSSDEDEETKATNEAKLKMKEKAREIDMDEKKVDGNKNEADQKTNGKAHYDKRLFPKLRQADLEKWQHIRKSDMDAKKVDGNFNKSNCLLPYNDGFDDSDMDDTKDVERGIRLKRVIHQGKYTKYAMEEKDNFNESNHLSPEYDKFDGSNMDDTEDMERGIRNKRVIHQVRSYRYAKTENDNFNESNRPLLENDEFDDSDMDDTHDVESGLLGPFFQREDMSEQGQEICIKRVKHQIKDNRSSMKYEDNFNESDCLLPEKDEVDDCDMDATEDVERRIRIKRVIHQVRSYRYAMEENDDFNESNRHLLENDEFDDSDMDDTHDVERGLLGPFFQREHRIKYNRSCMQYEDNFNESNCLLPKKDAVDGSDMDDTEDVARGIRNKRVINEVKSSLYAVEDKNAFNEANRLLPANDEHEETDIEGSKYNEMKVLSYLHDDCAKEDVILGNKSHREEDA